MSVRTPSPKDSVPRTRVDKWLWAARFFKHRSAATEAIDGGKVKLNGLATKPSREIKPGDRVDITVGEDTRTVMVCAIADKRGTATVAQTLYEETAESMEARERARELRKFAATLRLNALRASDSLPAAASWWPM